MEPVKYRITFEKDGRNVKVNYDLSLPIGHVDLIADFQVAVDGENLINGFLPGHARFNGVVFHVLTRPEEDVIISYSISTNQGWLAHGSDVLRGAKKYDGAEYEE